MLSAAVATSHGFCTWQVQREKQDLENTLEAEQERLVNKLQAQMRDMQLQNRY